LEFRAECQFTDGKPGTAHRTWRMASGQSSGRVRAGSGIGEAGVA
jgi:hypothetical protein